MNRSIRRNRLTHAGFGLASVVWGCGAADGTKTEARDLADEASPLVQATQPVEAFGFLGGGYNNWRDEFNSVPCLNQLRIDTLGGAGWLMFGSRLTADELKQELSMKAGGNLNLDLFKLGASSKYFYSAVEQELSASFHFLFNFETRHQRFISDPNSPATGVARDALAQGLEPFYLACGDQFLSQVLHGGKLFVTMTYQFRSDFEKRQFAAEVGGSFFDVFGGNVDYSKLSEETRRNTTLSIMAFQQGGAPEKLATILGTPADQTGVFASSQCNLASPERCNGLIAGTTQYAQGAFATDLAALPAVLGYVTSDYTGAGIAVPPLAALPADISAARRWLADSLESQVADRARANYLRSEYEALLTAAQLAALDGLVDTIDANVDVINEAAHACFRSIPDCVARRDDAASRLRAYDRALLVAPAAILLTDQRRVVVGAGSGETFCALPDGYVITGVGGRVKNDNVATLVLEGRKLGENGRIGARTLFRCGAQPSGGIEAWVSLPDGWVATGVGARAKDDNLTTLRVFARQLSVFDHALGSQLAEFAAGTAPAQPLESSFLAESSGMDARRTVLTGVGMRCKKDNIVNMLLQVATLR